MPAAPGGGRQLALSYSIKPLETNAMPIMMVTKMKQRQNNLNNKDKSIDASSATTKKISDRPLNSYNLFFILERELLLLQKNRTNSPSPSSPSSSTAAFLYSGHVNFNDYVDLVHNFPPLPSKYQSIDLPVDWFMHGKDKQQRQHVRSHGIIKFSDLATLMASKWKATKQGEEKETLEYVATVAAMVKQRRNELRVMKKEHRSHLPDARVDASSTASVLPSSLVLYNNSASNAAIFSGYCQEVFSLAPARREVPPVQLQSFGGSSFYPVQMTSSLKSLYPTHDQGSDNMNNEEFMLTSSVLFNNSASNGSSAAANFSGYCQEVSSLAPARREVPPVQLQSFGGSSFYPVQMTSSLLSSYPMHDQRNDDMHQ
ncbi:predicted protein [Thalassiosira pseudonana CCMP1335]|uniref:HMG box domain-containing protein n=1 Tax=Thalassiosira pseudonana TaxID=35128 RepID=B8C244_THAPS|nr:predicted protein [Thalassiosira pseudonana CCMP1335]EED91879.1 predicted protein [Thalassiosira pseudonana CCMP1335]